jgi:uncharacterized protein (TIGR02284 family)
MANLDDQLASLHTAAIDARNGYDEAAKKAGTSPLTPLFQELARLHEKHATEIHQVLVKRGRSPSDDGSFMTVVHETIMDVRALVGGLGESVLPGLIDGEKRNIAKYDDAPKDPTGTEEETMLTRQRGELAAIVKRMEGMKTS